MENMITMEQFEQLNDVRANAQADDTPYIGVMDGGVNINGNPNKTEIKPADYTVYFCFPDTKDFRRRIEMTGDKIVEEKGGWLLVERVYKNVWLTPRRVSDAVTAGAVIWQYLNKVTEDGEIRPLTYEEQLVVMKENYKDLKETALELVATVLGIDKVEQEFLAPVDTVRVAFEIAMNTPSMVNESDFFTEPLFGKRASRE